MNPSQEFINEKNENIERQSKDINALEKGREFIWATAPYKYTYSFSWMGRPIIQFPQDMIAMQEIIWEIKPDLIIETGIAHGGSLIYYASILELIGKGEVLGIDIDIREHNKREIEKHSMFKRIKLIQGSSIEEDTFQKVKDYANNKQMVLVCLDSNHTHSHVLEELRLYSDLVTTGSYIIAFDTLVEDTPVELQVKNRSWGKGNNPKTAVLEFLKGNNRFEIDKSIQNKLLITVAPDGYLKRVK
jgi:cephalosporin hydroxylase